MDNKEYKELYSSWTYDTQERFSSYWHQINEVISIDPENILEVGVGNGFVGDYLKKKGFSVSSVDNNPELMPDIVGDIKQLPVENDSFDISICFEVLEHIPYDYFETSLKELYRVSKTGAIISLPDITPAHRVFVELPIIGWIKKIIPGFCNRPIPHDETDIHHCWNVGELDHPLKRICEDIEKVGFKVEKTYRSFENPVHRFFVLKK